MTVGDVAVRLRTHRAAIYRLCRSGALRCYRAGRVLRIPVQEIERFENASGAQAEDSSLLRYHPPPLLAGVISSAYWSHPSDVSCDLSLLACFATGMGCVFVTGVEKVAPPPTSHIPKRPGVLQAALAVPLPRSLLRPRQSSAARARTVRG